MFRYSFFNCSEISPKLDISSRYTHANVHRPYSPCWYLQHGVVKLRSVNFETYITMTPYLTGKFPVYIKPHACWDYVASIIQFCLLHMQVIPEGASSVRLSAISHSVSVSRTRDILRPEVTSTNGFVSARDGPAVAENPTSSAHAQEGAEAITAEVRQPGEVVVWEQPGRRGWPGDETHAWEAARRNRDWPTETHTENTVQGASVSVLFILRRSVDYKQCTNARICSERQRMVAVLTT